MSGGSYEYLCFKLADGTNDLQLKNNPRRIAFQKLMLLVTEAWHDIEWEDSCDYGEGKCHAAIDKVMAFLGTDPKIIQKAAAYDALKLIVREHFEEISV